MKRMSNLMSWRKPEERKMKKFVAFALALALVVFALPTAIWAGADVFHYSFKGQSAVASFYTGDECSFTFADILAVDGRIKTEGKPEVMSYASIYVAQYDYCTGTYLDAYGSAELEEEDFQIDKKLNSATLDTTIEVYDYYSGNSFPVDVRIDWTGFGDIFSGKFHNHYQGPGYRINDRYTGSYRDAEPSGTVSGGPIDLTEFSYAYMNSSSNASVSIYK